VEWVRPSANPLWVGRVFIFFCFVFMGLYLIALGYNWGPAFFGGPDSALITSSGEPVGGDFSHFYAGALLAYSGKAQEIYQDATLQTVLKETIGVRVIHRWPYPPTFILLVLPLALLPYLAALGVWLLVTLSGYLFVLWRIAPCSLTLWLALAFPGTFLNFNNGQNGFLSTFFLGGGLLLLERSPFVAGLSLGLMSYKPHLAVLIPVALLVGRCWWALVGAMVSAGGLALASCLILGPEVWHNFLSDIPVSVGNLTTNILPMEKVSSFYAAVRLAGGGQTLAIIVQALVMLACLVILVWVWRRNYQPWLRNAVLVTAVLLFTPHVFYYDLALLALPLAWLGKEIYLGGGKTLEKIVLFMCWLMPA